MSFYFTLEWRWGILGPYVPKPTVQILTISGFFSRELIWHRCRLKGITCGLLTTDHPPRKRSNSLPFPKIEVTTCRGSGLSAAAASSDQKKLGSDLSSDHTSVKRTSSMSTTAFRKKSVGQAENPSSHHSGGIHAGTGFKTFKTFVQSKILSKSDRALATTPNNGNETSMENETKKSTTTQALSARDHFMRRSSRTSFTEIDMVSEKYMQNDDCTL